MTESVDVQIVAYRSRESIRACVESAVRCSHVQRVLIVDHAGDLVSDDLPGLDVRVTQDTSNPGFGAGHNRLARYGTSPFICLLNPDASLVSTSLAVGVAFLLAHPEAAAVQGVVISSSSGRPERSQGVELGPVHLFARALGLGRFTSSMLGAWLARRWPRLRDHAERVPGHPVEVEALAATALLIRREAFESVGGFDEEFFLYGEDLDLARRLRLRGWRLVALPDLWATHAAGSSSGSWHTREIEWWRGTLRFAAKWWPARSWMAARIAGALRAGTMLHRGRWRKTWSVLCREPRAIRRSQPRPVT